MLFQAIPVSQWILTAVLTNWLLENVLLVFPTSNYPTPTLVFLNKLLLKLPTVKWLIQQMPDTVLSVHMDIILLEQPVLKFPDFVMDIMFKLGTVSPVNLAYNWSVENALINTVIHSHQLKSVPHVLPIIK